MQINSFLGIRNTVPARSIPDNAGRDWLDVDLDDAGAALARPGYSLSLPLPIDTAYNSHDGAAYLVSGGVLYQANLTPSGLTYTAIVPCKATAFTDKDGYLWTNDGLQVYQGQAIDFKLPIPAAPQVTLTSGTLPAGIYNIVATQVSPDGLMSGASEVVTVRLDAAGGIDIVPDVKAGFTPRVWMTDGLGDAKAGGEVFYDTVDGSLLDESFLAADSFPANAELIEWHDSRLCAAVFHDSHTFIFYSEKNRYHLWDSAAGYCVIPGHVLDMRSAETQLIVATDTKIYATDLSSLTPLAHYGINPGEAMRRHPDNGQVYIASKRGICVALPFQNLTEKKCSLPTGNHTCAHFLHRHGAQYFVALHDGGAQAFNDFGNNS